MDQMPTKRHKPEEIVAKLRQVDVRTTRHCFQGGHYGEHLVRIVVERG
jgi:hypothetical protein